MNWRYETRARSHRLGKVPFWDDPAHVLVGNLAAGSRSHLGHFRPQSGRSGFDDPARPTSEGDTREDRDPVEGLTPTPKARNELPHVSWSSSALASCRIGVSKPSVNQP